MKKIDSTVSSESKYIAICVIIFSLITQAVFLLLGKWDYTVLLGNILSAFVSVMNFFLMGVTLQSALNSDEKTAKNKMRLSQGIRMFMIFVAAAVGCAAPCFNTLAVLIPFFFPRIAIAVRPLL